ncbi:response regulator transcription factor [Sessilibacter sp. MAH2]
MQSLTSVEQVIIADDHPLFRMALKNTIERLFPETNIREAEDFNSLAELLQAEGQRSQLLLLDLQMPGCEGFSALIYVLTHFSHIPVVVVSAHSEPEIIRRSMDHGAAGFLPKSADLNDMGEAINTVLAGGLWQPDIGDGPQTISDQEQSIADSLSKLTQQQFRVASMVYQGLLNKQIAAELNITEATVKAHMTEIFKKLGVNSRTQVVLALGQLAVKPPVNLEEYRISH